MGLNGYWVDAHKCLLFQKKIVEQSDPTFAGAYFPCINMSLTNYNIYIPTLYSPRGIMFLKANGAEVLE